MSSLFNGPTVVGSYTSQFKPSDNYESEAQLEEEMIKALCTVGYEFRSDINDSKSIMQNLRDQIEALNGTKFSESEWNQILNNHLLNDNDSPVVSKTERFQSSSRYALRRDDGTTFNIDIIDKQDLSRNKMQVIHQYVAEDGLHVNRYDVTILCNGIPVVHVELKRRGVPLIEAFNQIRRYGKESFWSGNRLFEYVQLFVISNGTKTKYYSNTTRYNSIDVRNGTVSPRVVTTCNSFEFTSYWTDVENNHIEELMDFSVTFLAKDTILKILTRYCVFNTEKQLLVMRPYQIAASEAIMYRVNYAIQNGINSCPEAGGYIWHTTGSGKTLTSFKTAQLMSSTSEIDKVIFVVDRKDLDYQSMKEFEKFQEGAVNGSSNTRMLKKVLDDDTKRIVVTTIQKLSRFVHSYAYHPLYKKRVVIIFDECHRSQFGVMHKDITDAFRNYHLFGFTGTPIFPENAHGTASIDNFTAPQTTEQRFGPRLHTYTIVDAFRDNNVLRFKVDYVSTIRMKAEADDKLVEDIDRNTLMDPKRIANNVDYILDNVDAKTHMHESYMLGDRRVWGFNSMFAVGSTQMAIAYYKMFKKKVAERGKDFKVAVIYTYQANQEFDDWEPSDDDDELIGVFDAKEELARAVDDYNHLFGEVTDYSIDGDGFGRYYKNVSERMKKRDLDMLIVVDMFLTGFDSKALNTLWVDRNFKYHGLIQAFSRTNRIINKVKDHGNIVCFRKMKKRVDDAIALFGDNNAGGNIIMLPFCDYYDGYLKDNGQYVPGFKDMVQDLIRKYPLKEFSLKSEDDLFDFVTLFGKILRLYNLLMSYDDFTPDKRLLTPGEIQNYKSHYLDTRDDVKRLRMRDKEDIRDDLIFETELLFQNTITISYVLSMLEGHEWGSDGDRQFKMDIERKIKGDIRLRSKLSLIMAYINRISDTSEPNIEWNEFVKQRRTKELDEIVSKFNLNREKTFAFIDSALENDYYSSDGSDFSNLLPKTSRFSQSSERRASITEIDDALRDYFELYKETV